MLNERLWAAARPGCDNGFSSKASQQAEPDPVVPKQLDLRCLASSKREDRAVERVPSKMLLDQHGKTIHPFAHIRPTAGKIDPNSGTGCDHRPLSAVRTRESAA